MSKPFEGHTHSIYAIVYSPDGRLIVTGSGDKTIRVWDALTGAKAMEPWKGHIAEVNTISFSPDGRKLVSGGNDRMLRVWDVSTGECILGPLTGHEDSVLSVVFSPDGRLIASGSFIEAGGADTGLLLWNAKTGEMIKRIIGHTLAVLRLAFTPDGKRLASGSYDNKIRVFDVETGNLILGPLTGHTAPVGSVDFSPDGRRLVSGSDDHSLRVWDSETGETVIGPLESHSGMVECVKFSPDGEKVVSGGRDTILRMWNSRTGALLASPLEGHNNWVWAVTFSPDGTRIASGGRDLTVRIWNAENGEAILLVKLDPKRPRTPPMPTDGPSRPFRWHTDAITAVAYFPDGTRVASASNDRTIRIWEAHTGSKAMDPLMRHPSEINAVVVSPDSRRIASGADDVRVWDSQTGKRVLGPLQRHTGQIHSLQYSPDGQLIAGGGADNEIRVWNAETGEVVNLITGHTDAVRTLAFSPNGQRLASGGICRTIRIWDIFTGQLTLGLLKGHRHRVRSIVYSPDGRCIASGSNDLSLRVWDTESGRMILGPLTGHTDWIGCIVYSPDGRRLASCSYDMTIRVWDAITGDLLLGPLKGHKDAIRALAYSPDGMQILSGSSDCTLRVWDANDGRDLTPAIFPTESSSSSGNEYSGLTYSHLFSHTMDLVKRHQPSQAHSLHANYLGWTAHSNEIAQFINHRIIYLGLHEYLAQISLKNQNSENLRSLDDIMKDDRNQIAARISTMLQTQHLRKVFFDQRGPQAQSLLDLLQELLDNLPLPDTRSHLVTVLVRLSRESGLYPERLLLEDVQIQSLFPLAGGSYGDVWKGSLDGRVVAVKMMRTYHTQDERLFKTFAKEAVLWARLSNPYVLPLLGVYCIFEPIHRVCLVSPWMDNRNLSQYLEEHPETNRLSLIQDVALGLDYLHSFEPPVIHGDLKGVNILITAERRACVADFGLCILVQNTKIQCTMSSSAHSAGTFHWMAPELLQVEEGTESIRKTCSSDVYAFGCVCFEIYDGKPPFSKLPRPTHTSLDDNIWTLIQRCLVTDPEARPNMKQITQKLKCHPDVQSHRTHFLG